MNRLARSAKNHKAPIKETIISPKNNKTKCFRQRFLTNLIDSGVGGRGHPREIWIEACLPCLKQDTLLYDLLHTELGKFKKKKLLVPQM